VILCSVCHIFRKKREPAEWADMVIRVKGQELFDELLKRGESIEKVDYDQVEAYLNSCNDLLKDA
jgi:hypothetical protein